MQPRFERELEQLRVIVPLAYEMAAEDLGIPGPFGDQATAERFYNTLYRTDPELYLAISALEGRLIQLAVDGSI